MAEKNPSGRQELNADKLALQNGGFNKCLGYEKITITDEVVKTLKVPKNANQAIIVPIGPNTLTSAEKEIVLWWTENKGTTPTTGPNGTGMPLGHLGLVEIKGVLNLRNFKMIGYSEAKSISVRVQYY